MSRLLARLWLKLWRWTTVPPMEPIPAKCVMIAAPHTTNWDFPITLAMANVSGVHIKWLGKDALFKGVMGPIMRRLGGVSIDRSAPGGMVSQLADTFAAADSMVLVVPAEGTRARTEHWKSGFYRIAEQAGVPIVCAFVDKTTRSGGFGPVISPSGDLVADMDKIRAFYAGKEGLKANRFGPVRLREETPPSTSGQETPPSTSGQETPPSTSGQETPPSTSGQETPPSTSGQETSPSTESGPDVVS